MSGMDCAPSHLEMDCLLTFSFSASSSCDKPFFFLSSMILSASIMDTPFVSLVWDGLSIEGPL